MTKNDGPTTEKGHIPWLDNLRTIIIFLVVAYHVGGVYEAAGMWAGFWIVDDPSTVIGSGIVNILLDVFVMPTMFFLAGYLVPASRGSKTRWEFIRAKLKRLMVPWVIAVFTLIPLYKVIFLYSRNLPQQHWTTYFHFSEGNISSQNWLWFLPVLFSFNVLYLFFDKIRIPKLSLKVAVVGISVLGFISSFFIGGFLGFRSWSHSPFIDFENERLLVYFMVFLLGSFCFREGVFQERPRRKTFYTVVCSIAWIPLNLHIFARLYPFFYPQGFSVSPLYRVIWWLSFDLTLLCMLYLLVQTFWRYFDKTGRIWGELNRNSYGVYIIHVIVIGVLGTLLLSLNWPGLVKYPLLVILAYLSSNLLVSFYHGLVRTRTSGSRKAV